MHVSHPKTLLLGLATLASLGLAARPASAQIVTQFNSPITTVTSPSANETITLSGVITNFGSTAVTATRATVSSPLSDTAGDTIMSSTDNNVFSQTFAPGTSTSVDLVDVFLSANQAPGLYNFTASNGRAGLPLLTLDFSDGKETNTNFAVNVVPAAPAPEPSSVAGLGLGVLGVAGLLLKARRRKSLIV